MQTLYVYSRDASGTIEYKGPQQWLDRQQALEYFCQAQERREIEQMQGWPHSTVTWHGNLGFGEAS